MFNNKGFTLVELMIVMAMFIGVILISTNAFETILRSSAKITKSVETNVEGMIGLEMMRADLQQAGYALPWGFHNMSGAVGTYNEAANTANYPVAGINRSSYNDPPGDPPTVSPRAVAGSNGNGLNGSDYLVVKSAVIANNQTCKKTTYVNYTPAGGVIAVSGTDDLVAGERAVVLRSAFSNHGPEARELVGVRWEQFYHTIADTPTSPMPPDMSPRNATQTYFIFGIDPAAGTALRMPFNRADFFIKKPGTAGEFPKICNPNTGILYKGVTRHADGGLAYYPLLDCAADMQVIYKLNMVDEGENDTAGTYANPAGEFAGSESGVSVATVTATLGDAGLLRESLKEIRVYILAQEGAKDRTFSYPSQHVVVGEFGIGRTFDLSTLGGDWRNYRWKLYTIVVEPKNLTR